jgi:hypothetical protein
VSYAPPVTFRSLPETYVATTAFDFLEGCRHILIRKLTSLGFLPLQHLLELGVHLAGVCLAPYVALSGFDYPLSGFLLPEPLGPVSCPSALGFLPLQSLSPFEERGLSRD